MLGGSRGARVRIHDGDLEEGLRGLDDVAVELSAGKLDPLTSGQMLQIYDCVATNLVRWYVSFMSKRRLSASVDAELLEAAEAAVARGRAESVSAWINEALHTQLEHDRRLRALDELIFAYEAKHGLITEEEMQQAQRSARERAVVVRGHSSARSGKGRRSA